MKKLSFDVFFPKLKMLDADLYVVEFGVRNIFQILFLKILGKGELAFWGHGRERSRNFNKFENILRTRILSLADYFFVYTESGKEYLVESASFVKERIFVVNNSTDTRLIASAKLTSFEDPPSSLPLSFSDQNCVTVAAIASLEKSKKIDVVLEIHSRMREEIYNFQTLICGDGPERENLERISTEGVFFLGRVSPSELAQISKIIVAIVSPGPVGLVVTDSFAMGTPIITSASQNHGPEFSYLINNVNGLIVPDLPNMYVEAIKRMIWDTNLKNSLQLGLAKSVQDYNIEIMVSNYLSGIKVICENQL
jgi:glycosyltransferase involved in cell wall biosynthesis